MTNSIANTIRWTKQITSTQVLHLIRSEPDTRKALTIFNAATAEYSNGYRHDHETFSLIIFRLASSNLFSSAHILLNLALSDLQLSLPLPEPPFLSLLHAYGRAHRPIDALQLFRRMTSEFHCTPNIKSYVTVLTALVDGGRMKMAHDLYKEMKELGFDQCTAAYNVMIKAFCKSVTTIDSAMKVFETMPKIGYVPDSYTYGTLISGLCRVGMVEKAFELFEEMRKKECKAGVISYSALIHGLFVSGRVDEGLSLFSEMDQMGVKANVVTYSTVVDGLCKAKRSVEAINVLERMVRARCPPNKITYSSLVDGLCREGKIQEAMEITDRMRLHGHKADAGLYSKLIQGLFDNDRYKEAADFLDEMILSGVKPNRLTWSLHIRMHNMVAKGLCKGNDPNRAFQVYLSMQTRCITTVPETYHSLINGFCEKGDLHKAAQIVTEMLNDGCVPEEITWITIMNGFWDARNVRQAAQYVLTRLSLILIKEPGK